MPVILLNQGLEPIFDRRGLFPVRSPVSERRAGHPFLVEREERFVRYDPEFRIVHHGPRFAVGFVQNVASECEIGFPVSQQSQQGRHDVDLLHGLCQKLRCECAVGVWMNPTMW